MVRSANTLLPIEPTVELLLMDAKAAFAEPNHLKVFGVFAKVIRFADADTKDFRHLFSGIRPLTGIAASFRIHQKYSFLQPDNYSGVRSTSFPPH